MASKEMLDMLNKAIARELQVTIQYMWQHVMWKGVKGFSVKDELKSIGITEMKHAEEIAERLTYLGGTPTTKPEPIFVGGTLKEMIEHDKKDEEGAIQMYKDLIKMADKEGDEVTKRMFQKILADEEEHHDTFSGLLEEI
ncbi:MAG: ferritin-like domain-containing protein [candidate division WOR-3 bacterium]|nr:MAG: ferritin-like domain-containing protein [candidate division WOR-3 bacterium]